MDILNKINNAKLLIKKDSTPILLKLNLIAVQFLPNEDMSNFLLPQDNSDDRQAQGIEIPGCNLWSENLFLISKVIKDQENNVDKIYNYREKYYTEDDKPFLTTVGHIIRNRFDKDPQQFTKREKIKSLETVSPDYQKTK